MRKGKTDDPLFISNRGTHLSRDAVEGIVRRHVETASKTCRSLRSKRVTPHVLRHSAAMQLLHGGVDRTVIAPWLGHESVETTQMYIHADMKMKEKAIAKTRPVEAKHGRYRPQRQAALLPGSALIMPTCRAGVAHLSAGSTIGAA
jgi:integrase/recombinase XerD